MHLSRRQTCRICGSTALERVVDLGAQYLQGAFVKPENPHPPLRKIPLSLLRCDPSKDQNACGLLQLEYSVPPAILYSTYWYRSGTSQTMRKHLQGLVHSALEIVDVHTPQVLDIGCNDGTLLSFYPEGCRCFGVDPSNAIPEGAATTTFVHDFFPSMKMAAQVGSKAFDIVTSVAVLYDLDDPQPFAEAVRDLLRTDGVWIFETSYLPAMLKNCSYDTICHEHLEYYSLATLENLLRRAGLKIFRVELNTSNGGSIRCFAARRECIRYDTDENIDSVESLRLQEFDLELDTAAPYLDFQARSEAHRDELRQCVMQIVGSGKRVHLYGASTKGNTILQWCGFDSNTIECAAERSPDKFGAHTLGTNIPIVSEADSRAMNPDYYLVLPWHFRVEILEREREIIQRGTALIFPLPALEIIGREHRLFAEQ